MTEIFNIEKNLDIRRKLRKKSTPAENVLWSCLRNRNFSAYKFRRQYGIGDYVVDFYCPRLKLAIELDGGYHYEREIKEFDIKRQQDIEQLEITFLRFSNEEIIYNIDETLNKLHSKIELQAKKYK